MRATVAVGLSILFATAATACAAPRPPGITVFAAASLEPVFTELGARFEADHPGTGIVFNFAGSADLVTQLSQGAPADVFASANTETMTRAADAGLLAGSPVDFATNVLTIVTPRGNPTGIAGFADLAKPGTQVVVTFEG